MSPPQPIKIVITGGPCSGKTSLMAIAQQWLEDRGFFTVVVPETATELISAGWDPDPTKWKSPTDFQRHLMLSSLSREDNYSSMEKDRIKKDGRPTVFLYDRGALDSMAYIDRDGFLELLEQNNLYTNYLMSRYDGVVHLVTAADGAREFYTLENNPARSETPEQALALDKLTQQAWIGHNHFEIVDNSTDFEGKIDRAISAIARMVGEEPPREIERKFNLPKFDNSLIPPNAVEVLITQHYLTLFEHSKQGDERRIRMRTIDGFSTYFTTQKSLTDIPGIRKEFERRIGLREYESLMNEVSPANSPVIKVRHCFAYENLRFELDRYVDPGAGKFVLEVETDSLDSPIRFPNGWNPIEVTDDPRFSNQAISHSGFPVSS